MKVRRVALYGRVSTLRQALVKEGGLDTQFSSMDGYVASRNRPDERWVVHDRYREEGWSGKNLDRPEFRRMMRDVEAGLIDVIVVYKIDRISRSIRDFLDLYETFKRRNVQFVSVHEAFDTTTSIGRAMLKLVLVFAELEREQTAERTQATMEHRARTGLWNGGGRPLGYDLSPDRKGVLTPNHEEGRVVVEHVFRKYVETGSVDKVVRHLRALGIRKPAYESRRGRQRGGGCYAKMEVLRLLTNPVYVGKIRFKDEVFAGQHERLVSQELFDEAQRVLTRNRDRRGNSRDDFAHTFLLQGLLRCGRCGSFMTPKTSIGRGGKPHYYYQCTKNNHSSGTDCDAKYVPAEAAEEYVVGELRTWSLSPEEIAQVVRDANAQKGDRLGGLAEEEKGLKQRLREVEGKIGTIVDAVEGGKAFRSLSERLEELEAERAAMEGELARIRAEIAYIRQNALSAEVMAETYRTFPEMLDRLTAAGEWHAIKDLIARHVEVIDWHQDEEDPTTGSIEIMVFEEALAGREVGAEKTLDAAAVNKRCVESLERLREKDSNLQPAG